jgi:hypothetical protein
MDKPAIHTTAVLQAEGTLVTCYENTVLFIISNVHLYMLPQLTQRKHTASHPSKNKTPYTRFFLFNGVPSQKLPSLLRWQPGAA